MILNDLERCNSPCIVSLNSMALLANYITVVEYLIPFRIYLSYCSNFGHFAFSATLWGLRDNVQFSSWAHWKAQSGLPFSVN